jgi:hypothetical protein
VQAVPQLVLASSQNPSTAGEAVTLTVKVSAQDVIPTGTVTFRAGNIILAEGVTLDQSVAPTVIRDTSLLSYGM